MFAMTEAQAAVLTAVAGYRRVPRGQRSTAQALVGRGLLNPPAVSGNDGSAVYTLTQAGALAASLAALLRALAGQIEGQGGNG